MPHIVHADERPEATGRGTTTLLRAAQKRQQASVPTRLVQRLQMRHAPAVSPNIEFIRILGDMFESFFHLLDQGTEDGSEQESSDENHPSREYQMVQMNPVVAGQANLVPPPDPAQL